MKFKAFGLMMESDFEIPQALPCPDGRTDVTIRRSDLSGVPACNTEEGLYLRSETCFRIEGTGLFRITGGNLVEVDPAEEGTGNELSVYLMGSCMGAIFHQRGWLPLHGSCVTDGSRAILLAGNSGAGKSTLAAEFLSRGWQLVTDDVCVVKNINSVPLAQSSYPSQKLWNDSLARYAGSSSLVSLYTQGKREKFGVSRLDQFYDGACPLSCIVRLVLADLPETEISVIERIPAIEQVRRNTYRAYMIDPSERNAYFQKCITLSGKVRMLLALRSTQDRDAAVLCNKLLDALDQ